MNQKTIAAISTPPGKGGIAVVRISGQDAIDISDKMFKPKNGKSLSEIPGGHTAYGNILYEGNVIDDGIATVFRAPKSFTGEDTVEISCHGGILLTQMVLESTFLCGAFPAEPGEYSMRAFMSGHMSLSQAEAVVALIDAESRSKIAVASAQSRGALCSETNKIYENIKNLLAQLYVVIDYPEEDLSSLSGEEIEKILEGLICDLETLSSTYRIGHAVSEGIPTVIIGKPNVGKSSLLNRMVGRDRAIVTAEAGTTRDVIEETVQIGRVLLRLCDTAGIRNAESEAEKIGVDLAFKKMEEAELVLAVFDFSSELDENDIEIISKLAEYKRNGGKLITVINKNDLPRIFNGSDEIFENSVFISAKNGEGYSYLVNRIEELYFDGKIELNNSAIVLNARQYTSLIKTTECLKRALDAQKNGLPSDLVGIDIELSLSELGQLDGKTVSEEVVNSIFSRFCVGK